MNNEHIRIAETLIEALPFIREFFHKTVVIKYGGAVMYNESLRKDFLLDIVLMQYVGIHPVIVHGGGPFISKMMEKMGKTVQFINGLRITDKETMEIVEMVLGGKLNKEIVAELNKLGGKAVGLTGKDGGLIKAEKVNKVKLAGRESLPEIDLGFVGNVTSIDSSVIRILDSNGYIPVIAPIGVGEDGLGYNVNADIAAGFIAGSLSAYKVIFMTDVEGIMKDPKNIKTLYPTLSLAQLKTLEKKNIIKTGMIPKIKAVEIALKSGVKKVHIINGGLKHSILLEVFTESGIGTEIHA